MEFDNFLKAKASLQKKGWYQSTDGGCGIGGLFTIRSMFSFPRIEHIKNDLVTKSAPNSARAEYARTHPSIETELVDGPLIIIYQFYCKIQQPGSKIGSRPDFDDIRSCNQSLSFLGVATFLRDFDFAPKYVLSDVRHSNRGLSLEERERS
jgi:hypothetical protein